jgi:hypothetical protein
MRIRINDFLARNESPVIASSRTASDETGVHGMPASGAPWVTSLAQAGQHTCGRSRYT